MTTKKDFSFDYWFDSVVHIVHDASGVEFQGRDAIRKDYDDGCSLLDVAQEIINEIHSSDSLTDEQASTNQEAR